MKNQILEAMKGMIGKTGNSPSSILNDYGGKFVKAEEGNLSIQYEVQGKMCNPAGSLHGGIMACLLDDTMGAAVYSLNNEFLFTSVNLTTDFLKTVRLNEIIIVSGTVLKKGRTIIYIEGAIHNEKGDLVAKATSNLLKTKIRLRAEEKEA